MSDGRIAVLGRGAREDALARRIAAEVGSPSVDVVPGNAGTVGATGPLEPLAEALVARGVDLVVIGPEALLAAGVADALRAAGLAVVGPSAQAAQLETSKAFAKAFMERHGVPTAHARLSSCERDDAAIVAATAGPGPWSPGPQSVPGPAVAKYDGLAEGKGVTVCETPAELAAALADLRARFGPDAPILVEERLTGPELSVMLVVADGQWVELPEARDHKRLLDFDEGPNTGGMGAFSPVLAQHDPLWAAIRDGCIAPTVRGLVSDGQAYRGFLYVGLMLTPAGPRVLEYNTRLGDPETQVVLPRVQGDFVRLLRGCATGALPLDAVSHDPRHAVGVVVARRGYPSAPLRSEPPRLPPGVSVIVGNAALDASGAVILPAGRALTAVGLGATHATARADAYRLVDALISSDPEAFHARRDIGRVPTLAVFASGTGSNLRALHAATVSGVLLGRARVGLLVSDRPDAGAVAFAESVGVPTFALSRKSRSAAEWEASAAAALEERHIDAIALAGFMRILSPAFIARFTGRIVNIHPADTRVHQGLGGYEYALEHGLESTRITVHRVDEGLDTGEILAQAEVDLRGADTLDAVRARGLTVEHRLYPEAIAAWLPSLRTADFDPPSGPHTPPSRGRE